MRNFKKFLALVMATLMILSAAVITTGAAGKADYTDAAQHLVALKIMKGDEKGNLMLDNGVTRYQAALFFAQTLSGETRVEVWNADKKSTAFKDVTEYGTAIDYVYGRKVVAGRGNGVFGPNDPITYQDMLVMAVRALGYETADMSYPYGYILAAQKLGLTDNVENVNYKAALTRGETSQIIWDMLNTVIAVVDPLNDKILYPDDKGLTEAITDKKLERKTMLVDSGYASGEISGTITAFVKAADDDDVDTVVVDGTYNTGKKDKDGNDIYASFKQEIAVADLGLTDVAKVEYLGRAVTLFVDEAVADFEKDYDVIADNSDASVVYADFETYTVVENLGNAGNIKWDEANKTLTLDGSKFKDDGKSYNINLYTFVEKNDKGWVKAANINELSGNFVYTSKDGYVGDNTYGKVEYYVVDGGKGEADTLNVYYTPYSFGQYFNRTIKYQPTSKDASFVTIASYVSTQTKNFDGTDTYFEERLVSSNTKITDATKSVSKSNGEDAMNTKLAGETVKSGDFMFYSYNKLDNILTVAQTGSFKEGRLTSFNANKETVKIDGTNKDVAFKGAFDFQFNNSKSLYENYAAAIKGFVNDLEAGKNNVKYIELDGNVVYMEKTSTSASNDKNSFDFVIATTDPAKMANLLDVKDADYPDKLTKGVYLDDNGYVGIAVLDTATGKWKLASVKNFYYGTYNADKTEFKSKLDLGETAKYYDMIGDTYNKKADFEACRAALNGAAIFYAVNEKDGVYDLAAVPAYNSGNDTTPTLVAGSDKAGLVFSETTAKTNKIQATNDEDDAARVTLNKDTVIAVINGNKVGVRTGVQKDSRSLNVTAGNVYFLSANSSLIIMDLNGATLKDASVLTTYWGYTSSTATANETYYIALADYSVDIDATEDDKYEVTVSNLFDLKTLKAVESIKVTVDKIDDATKIQGFKKGDLLHLTEDADLEKETVKTVVEAALELIDNDDLVEANLAGLDFEDDTSITIPGLVDKATPTKINVKVVTVDVTGIDKNDYAFDNAIVAEEANGKFSDVATMEDFKDAKAYYTYTLGADAIAEITEPTEGVLDNFVAAMVGKTIIVPGKDESYSEYASLAEFTTGSADKSAADYETLTVTLSAYADYDSKNGTLDLTVFKIVK